MTDLPPSTQAPRQTLAERYGAGGSPGRRTAVAVVSALGLLSWVAWAFLSGGSRVSGAVESFDVRSEHAVAVVVRISRSDEGAVRCTLTAQAEDHTVVAEDVVEVPPGETSTVRVETTLRTEREAVTASVTGCTTAG